MANLRRWPPTLSVPNALGDAVFPVHKVVLVSSAAAVVKHLAPLGLRVEREPPVGALARPPLHGTEAQLRSLQLCKPEETL